MISSIQRSIAYTMLLVTVVGVMYLYAMEQDLAYLFNAGIESDDESGEEYNAATHEIQVDSYLKDLESQGAVVESPIISPKSPRQWISARHQKKADESQSGSAESVDSQIVSPTLSPRPARQNPGTWVSPRLQRTNQGQDGAKFATLKNARKAVRPTVNGNDKQMDTLQLSDGKILQLDSKFHTNLDQLESQLIAALEKKDFQKAAALIRSGANIHGSGGKELLDKALAAKDLEIVYFLQDHHVKLPSPELPKRLSMAARKEQAPHSNLVMRSVKSSSSEEESPEVTSLASPVPSPLPSPRPGKREATAQPWVASVIENGHASPAFFSIGESRQVIKKNATIPRISGEAQKSVVSHDELIKINTKKFHEIVRKAEPKDFTTLSRLLDSGVDVNSLNEDDSVPALVVAVRTFNFPLITYLIQNGAEVNTQGQKYDVSLKRNLAQPTALQEAARYGHVKMVQYLIKFGANPNIADGRNTTPLMVAVFGVGNAAEMVARVLINAGADVLAKNNVGQTALDFAGMFRGKEDFLDYIDRKQQEALAGQVPQSVVESYVESTIETPSQNEVTPKKTEEEELDSRLIY